MLTSGLAVFGLGTLLLGAAWVPAQIGGPVIGPPQQSVDQFLDDHPGTAVYMNAERVAKVYGRSFSQGVSPVESAAEFVRANAGMFHVQAEGLVLGGPNAPEGRVTQPIMYDQAIDAYKFIGVNYSQVQEGIPVFRARAMLLVRNEPGFPLVMVSANLRDLSGFQLDQNAPINPQAAQRAALRAAAGLKVFGDQDLVIWAGVDDMVVEPRLAIRFVAQSGSPHQPDTFQKWLFLVDAATGAILYQEDQILEVDVVGNVSGVATQGIGADICEDEALVVMPWAKVSIQGGNTAFADENGDFTIPNAGGGEVTVLSPVEGRYFEVDNEGGANTVLSTNVVPPGPANFIHNQANTSEFIRAEVNGYIQANVVRDFVLSFSPAFPIIADQMAFDVNVNIAASCNATYSGDAINFYRSQGGCSNTANSTVVHHEYGHHLCAVANTGQGAYGEGTGDTMGVIITDQPGLALGFFLNCDTPGGFLRNADNNLQFPCGGGIHFCGQLLSGSVWSTRNELILTEPSNYQDILANLFVNSILLHSTGRNIGPDIAVDFLTLDDNDGDIFNGTPHCQEIQDGFGAHNMAAPDVDCPPPPPPCPWDLDGNNDVGVKDLLFLLGTWGPCPKKGDCLADFDNSGDVGVKDLLELLGAWGPCP
jgi:hypothetical protein